MSSSADLFVVCKKCGSEVSPYITECPYCGHRLRRRAPKLPRERPGKRAHGAVPGRRSSGRLRSGEIAGLRVPEPPPYVTIALVGPRCVVWIAIAGRLSRLRQVDLGGAPGRGLVALLSTQFVYGRGFSAGLFMFSTLLAVALFGALLERRHGPFVVLALFFAAAVAGAWRPRRSMRFRS